MNRVRVVTVSILLVLVMAVSCSDGGTKTGNGVTLWLQAYSSISAPAVAAASRSAPRGTVSSPQVFQPSEALETLDAQGTPFVLETLRAYVREVEFLLPDGKTCDDYSAAAFQPPLFCDANKVIVDGPSVADLAAGTMTPGLGILGLPAGTYERSDALLDTASSEEWTIGDLDPLKGYAVYADGTFEYGGLPRTFEFHLSFTQLTAFLSTTAIEVVPGQAKHLILSMDVADWFASLPLTGCLDSGELTLLEDSHLIVTNSGGGSCDKIEEALQGSIVDSAELDEEDGEH